jgi:hypothetical protein
LCGLLWVSWALTLTSLLPSMSVALMFELVWIFHFFPILLMYLWVQL